MIPVYRPNPVWLNEALAGPLAARDAGADMRIALVCDEGGDEKIDRESAQFWSDWQDAGIEIHRFPSRGGLAGNWNRCLDLANGHLVHLLHQDDRVQPRFYHALEAAFAAEPAAGAGFTQHTFIAADGTPLRRGHLEAKAPALLADWLEYVIANLAIQCPCIAVRRKVYEDLGGFDAAYRYCLDRDMWQRIAAEYPLWYEPAPLAEYRVHAGSETARVSRGLLPWVETRRCLRRGVELVSPAERKATARSGRRHLVRLAMNEMVAALGDRQWAKAGAAGLGAALIGTVGDFLAVARGRIDTAPMGRPSIRQSYPAGSKTAAPSAYAAEPPSSDLRQQAEPAAVSDPTTRRRE